MDKQTIAQTVTNAIQALDELERALEANDQRKTGAALYELRRQLDKLKQLAK